MASPALPPPLLDDNELPCCSVQFAIPTPLWWSRHEIIDDPLLQLETKKDKFYCNNVIQVLHRPDGAGLFGDQL